MSLTSRILNISLPEGRYERIPESVGRKDIFERFCFLSWHTRRIQNTEHEAKTTEHGHRAFFRTFSKIVCNFLYKNHQKNRKTEENPWDWDELNDAFGFFQRIFFTENIATLKILYGLCSCVIRTQNTEHRTRSQEHRTRPTKIVFEQSVR